MSLDPAAPSKAHKAFSIPSKKRVAFWHKDWLLHDNMYALHSNCSENCSVSYAEK